MTCPCGSNLPARMYAVGPRCPACLKFRRLHGDARKTVVDHSRAFVTRQARARAALEDRAAMREAQCGI